MPDDVRITGPAPGTIPTVETVVPPVVPPVVAAEEAPIAPIVPAAESPIVAVAAPAAESLPTAAPTLFELAEQRQAEKDKPKEVAAAEAEKPVAEAEKPKTEEVPPTEVEKPAAEAVKPEAPKVEAVPVEPTPIKFEYVLPENVTLPGEQAEKVHSALSAFAANPGDKGAQQALIDLHYQTLVDGITEYNKLAHKTFADTRQKWQRQVMDHPELGGGNHDAAMQAIAYVRDNFLSTHPRGSKQYEAAKKGLDEWMHLTGAGDNPHFLELMHNVSVRLNEPQMQGTQEIKPIVQEDNGGRPSIYKHPTSFPRR